MKRIAIATLAVVLIGSSAQAVVLTPQGWRMPSCCQGYLQAVRGARGLDGAAAKRCSRATPDHPIASSTPYAPRTAL
jgi:hypothetical protein